MSKKVQRPWLPVPKPYETGRVTARWEGYKTQRWRELSRWFKDQDENLICDKEGCGRPTYYTEHEIPALECNDPWDPSNFRPRCRFHGNSKTGKEGAKAKQVGEGGVKV